MTLKHWPPFSNRQTYAQWVEQQREEARKGCRDMLGRILFAVLVIALLASLGCAARDYPELNHWNCLQATGSYVQCKHLEVNT